MTVNSRENKRLRQIGHRLHPVVTVSDKGLSEGVRAELARAINDHELIKVKLSVSSREHKQQLTEEICRRLGAVCVQQVGHVVLLYRKAENPDPRLSNLHRA